MFKIFTVAAIVRYETREKSSVSVHYQVKAISRVPGNRAVNAKLVELLFPFFLFFLRRDYRRLYHGTQLVHPRRATLPLCSVRARCRPIFSDLILLRAGKENAKREREKLEVEGRCESEEDKQRRGETDNGRRETARQVHVISTLLIRPGL